MDRDTQRIADIFTDDFNSIFAYMAGKPRKSLAYLAPTVFVRWYYSALFSETMLSPAAIIENRKENVVPGDGFYSLSLRLNNVNGVRLDFKFKKNYYSINDHPIYEDLKTLLGYMSPALIVEEGPSLAEKDVRALQRRLSISDKYYVIYLFELAGKLGLYTEIPSLYEKCIQPLMDHEFFRLPPSEMFDRIVDISCGLCAEALSLEMPVDSPEITRDRVREMISSPASVDGILADIFDAADIDINELLDASAHNSLDEGDNPLLSSVFYMGIMLDRYFMYIFGHYLRLIRPLYSYPVDFRGMLNGVFNAIALESDPDVDLFMPCTAYVHTPLGSIFFGRRQMDMSKYPPIPVDRLLNSIEKERRLSVIRLMGSEYGTVYRLRACYNGDPSLWKIIELESSSHVTVAARHILMLFLFPPDTDFSIGLGDGSVIDFDKAGAVFDPGSSISDILHLKSQRLVINLSGGQFIEVNFVRAQTGHYEVMYPRLIEQSSEITQKEHSSYYYD